MEQIRKILSEAGLTPNHPDLLYFEQKEKLGIEQARQIIEHFSLKPYSAKGRAAVLEDASAMTTEAQNALLKTLEEPPEEAVLILGASSSVNLLPTILSRCEIVILKHDTDLVGRKFKTYEVYAKDIEKLLNQSIDQRFEYIEKLKDQEKRQEFLHALVLYFRELLVNSSNQTIYDRDNLGKFLKELITAEEWAEANVNIRGILEYLMLVMPSKL